MAPVSARRLSLNHFSHEACRPVSGPLAAAGVIALAALLFFARLGARSLWNSEFLWAEIAREMQLTHDYFWPAIIGRVYYDKPVVSYWLILAATWVTGMLNAVRLLLQTG